LEKNRVGEKQEDSDYGQTMANKSTMHMDPSRLRRLKRSLEPKMLSNLCHVARFGEMIDGAAMKDK